MGEIEDKGAKKYVEVQEIVTEAATESFGFFLGNVTSTLLATLGSIVIARLLGAELYGIYTLSLVLPTIFILFTSFGVDQGLTKVASSAQVVNDYVTIRKALLATLAFKALTGLSLSLLGIFLSDLLAIYVLNRPDMGIFIRFASLIILFQSSYLSIHSFLVSVGRASLDGVLRVLLYVIKLAISIPLILIGIKVLGAILGLLTSYIFIFTTGITLCLIRSKNRDKSSLRAKELLRKMVGYGLPIYLATLLSSLMLQYNRLVLAWFASNDEIGWYGAANAAANIITIFAMPLGLVLFPMFSKVDVISKERLSSVFSMSLRYSTLLIAPVATFTIIFSYEIVTLTFGKDFALASPYLSILSIFYLFQPFSMVASSYFRGAGMPRVTLLAALTIVMTITPLSPLLASLYGGIGAVIAFVVGGVSASVMSIMYCIIKIRLTLGSSKLLRIYISSLGAGLASFLTKFFILNIIFSFIAGISLFILCYLLLLGFLKALDTKDVSNLDYLLRRIKVFGRLLAVALSLVKIIMVKTKAK